MNRKILHYIIPNLIDQKFQKKCDNIYRDIVKRIISIDCLYLWHECVSRLGHKNYHRIEQSLDILELIAQYGELESDNIRETFKKIKSLLLHVNKEIRTKSFEVVTVFSTTVLDSPEVLIKKFYSKLRSAQIKTLEKKMNSKPKKKSAIITLFENDDSGTRVVHVTKNNFLTNQPEVVDVIASIINWVIL